MQYCCNNGSTTMCKMVGYSERLSQQFQMHRKNHSFLKLSFNHSCSVTVPVKLPSNERDSYLFASITVYRILSLTLKLQIRIKLARAMLIFNCKEVLSRFEEHCLFLFVYKPETKFDIILFVEIITVPNQCSEDNDVSTNSLRW